MSVEIWNYGDYSSSNYGSSRAVRIGNLTLYFSYRTVVAFNDNNNFWISKNVWSNTTGRHLNCINRNKSIRIDYEEFKVKLNECLKRHGLL